MIFHFLHANNAFGRDANGPALIVAYDITPEMHDAIADRHIVHYRGRKGDLLNFCGNGIVDRRIIRPGGLDLNRHNRGQRLQQISMAHDANHFTAIDDGHAFDVTGLEDLGNERDGIIRRNRDDIRRHHIPCHPPVRAHIRRGACRPR